MPGLLKKMIRGDSCDKIHVMDIESYRNIYRNYPKPSEDQINDFVEYVSHAKSWYKHLPFLPPGVPFYFFFDQFAGWNRIKKFSGKIKYTKREEGDEQTHYSYIPTDQYQERFGLLAFSCERDTPMQEISFGGIQNSNRLYPFISTSDGQTYSIPEEVLEIGSVTLTAPIHSAIFQYYLRNITNTQFNALDFGEGKWPEETGGDEVLNKLVEIGRLFNEQRVNADKRYLNFRSSMSKQVVQLIAPEQNRLRNKMIITIKELCNLIYG